MIDDILPDWRDYVPDINPVLPKLGNSGHDSHADGSPNTPIVPADLPPGGAVATASGDSASREDEAIRAEVLRKYAGIIEGGERHKFLLSIAEPMRACGASAEAIVAALTIENEKHCRSPLSPAEVRRIVQSASRNAPCAPSEVRSTEWPDPAPLEDELPPVDAFDGTLLPPAFRNLVDDTADRMQTPPDFMAVSLVICLAAAVGRRALIQPKLEDSGWVVTPNLWGGICAAPGLLKSPTIEVATQALRGIQTKWLRKYEAELKEFRLEYEKSELKLAAWRELYKAEAKKGAEGPERPSDEPKPPQMRRIIVNDATVEALHQVMAANPAGILLLRDELTGWLSQLDRPGREGERAFALEAWNGNGAHMSDRIGRGFTGAEACCMSMLGGIQPGRLRSYLADALNDGPGSDGLVQRFQLLIWPDTPATWTYVDRPLDEGAKRLVVRVFESLVKLDVETPALLRFDPDAQELFVAWLSELEAKVRGDELHSALISHLSKYRSLMPSLALLLELAERASCDGFGASSLAEPNNLVSLEHTKMAAAWCDCYLESHARRLYSCVVKPQIRAARELANKIKKRKIAEDGILSIRKVYLKGWSGLNSAEAAQQAAEVLEDAGWIRALPSETSPIGGRPANRFEVNPKIWEQ